MDPKEFFILPQTKAQKQYCALAAFFKDGLRATDAAKQFGYTSSAFYSLVRDFKAHLETNNTQKMFFVSKQLGRKNRLDSLEKIILGLRKKGLSNTDIVKTLQDIDCPVSQAGIWRILSKHGYKKLPRRTKTERRVAGLIPAKIAGDR
jgi:predicted DNA-binding protein YlxM (UPF0122 family)